MHFDLGPSICFLGVTGSHAYGMARETSDVDVRGACIPPRAIRESPFKSFTQFLHHATGGRPATLGETWGELDGALRQHASAKAFWQKTDGNEIDLEVDALGRLTEFMAQANPNKLELLFLHPDDVLYSSDAWETLRASRELFLSTKAKFTYAGYAFSQLKRIKGHRSWLMDPPKIEPKRKDFDLPESTVLSADDRNRLDEAIKKIIRNWGVEDGLDDYIKGAPQDVLRERMIDFQSTVLRCEPDMLDEKMHELAGASVGLGKDVLYALKMERKYRGARKTWEQYKRWERERNEKRAALEAKFGFDCYLDDTEFLTERGWKRYDEIGEDERLATLNQATSGIEYQHFTERVAKPFSGQIGVVHGRHTRCAVTLNHRMWVSPGRRRAANNFSSAYHPEVAEWHIAPLTELVEGRRSDFHVRVTGAPSQPEHKVKDHYLNLMGAYVSEGCVGKRLKDGTASVLRISQKEGGDLQPFMECLEDTQPEWGFRRFSHLHDEDWRSEPCNEIIWTVAHREIAVRMEHECGSGSSNKRLPPWTRDLSQRQVKLLLETMVAGDGSVRKHSRIYHTSSKRLADDIQAMCVHAGIVSHVWGPYEPDGMFQVYLGPEQEVVPVSFRGSGSGSFEIEDVCDARIVCFTVPNEILVTRRHGKVAIQGNTKHGAHLIRLLRTGLEILNGKGLIVKRPDAQELLDIRDGAYSYDDLIKEAESLDAQLNEAYKNSPLPKKPNIEAIENLYLEILDRHG